MVNRQSSIRHSSILWGLELATAVWAGLVIVAAVLVARKLSGALTQQIPALAACLVATGMTGLSVSAYLLFQWTRGPTASKPAQIAAGVVTLIPPFALGIILLPGDSPVATSYVTALFLLASAVLIVFGKSAGLPTNHGGDGVSQWMTRSVTSEGWERIEGAVKVDFAPGQKQAVIHLPFYPPLMGQPEIECESLAESAVRFKVAAAHPYGARIEAKRAGEADTAETVEVGFTAVASPDERGAA